MSLDTDSTMDFDSNESAARFTNMTNQDFDARNCDDISDVDCQTKNICQSDQPCQKRGMSNTDIVVSDCFRICNQPVCVCPKIPKMSCNFKGAQEQLQNPVRANATIDGTDDDDAHDPTTAVSATCTSCDVVSYCSVQNLVKEREERNGVCLPNREERNLLGGWSGSNDISRTITACKSGTSVLVLSNSNEDQDQKMIEAVTRTPRLLRSPSCQNHDPLALPTHATTAAALCSFRCGRNDPTGLVLQKVSSMANGCLVRSVGSLTSMCSTLSAPAPLREVSASSSPTDPLPLCDEDHSPQLDSIHSSSQQARHREIISPADVSLQPTEEVIRSTGGWTGAILEAQQVSPLPVDKPVSQNCVNLAKTDPVVQCENHGNQEEVSSKGPNSKQEPTVCITNGTSQKKAGIFIASHNCMLPMIEKSDNNQPSETKLFAVSHHDEHDVDTNLTRVSCADSPPLNTVLSEGIQPAPDPRVGKASTETSRTCNRQDLDLENVHQPQGTGQHFLGTGSQGLGEGTEHSDFLSFLCSRYSRCPFLQHFSISNDARGRTRHDVGSTSTRDNHAQTEPVVTEQRANSVVTNTRDSSVGTETPDSNVVGEKREQSFEAETKPNEGNANSGAQPQKKKHCKDGQPFNPLWQVKTGFDLSRQHNYFSSLHTLNYGKGVDNPKAITAVVADAESTSHPLAMITAAPTLQPKQYLQQQTHMGLIHNTTHDRPGETNTHPLDMTTTAPSLQPKQNSQQQGSSTGVTFNIAYCLSESKWRVHRPPTEGSGISSSTTALTGAVHEPAVRKRMVTGTAHPFSDAMTLQGVVNPRDLQQDAVGVGSGIGPSCSSSAFRRRRGDDREDHSDGTRERRLESESGSGSGYCSTGASGAEAHSGSSSTDGGSSGSYTSTEDCLTAENAQAALSNWIRRSSSATPADFHTSMMAACSSTSMCVDVGDYHQEGLGCCAQQTSEELSAMKFLQTRGDDDGDNHDDDDDELSEILRGGRRRMDTERYEEGRRARNKRSRSRSTKLDNDLRQSLGRRVDQGPNARQRFRNSRQSSSSLTADGGGGGSSEPSRNSSASSQRNSVCTRSACALRVVDAPSNEDCDTVTRDVLEARRKFMRCNVESAEWRRETPHQDPTKRPTSMYPKPFPCNVVEKLHRRDGTYGECHGYDGGAYPGQAVNASCESSNYEKTSVTARVDHSGEIKGSFQKGNPKESRREEESEQKNVIMFDLLPQEPRQRKANPAVTATGCFQSHTMHNFSNNTANVSGCSSNESSATGNKTGRKEDEANASKRHETNHATNHGQENRVNFTQHRRSQKIVSAKTTTTQLPIFSFHNPVIVAKTPPANSFLQLNSPLLHNSMNESKENNANANLKPKPPKKPSNTDPKPPSSGPKKRSFVGPFSGVGSQTDSQESAESRAESNPNANQPTTANYSPDPRNPPQGQWQQRGSPGYTQLQHHPQSKQSSSVDRRQSEGSRPGVRLGHKSRGRHTNSAERPSSSAGRPADSAARRSISAERQANPGSHFGRQATRGGLQDGVWLGPTQAVEDGGGFGGHHGGRRLGQATDGGSAGSEHHERISCCDKKLYRHAGKLLRHICYLKTKEEMMFRGAIRLQRCRLQLQEEHSLMFIRARDRKRRSARADNSMGTKLSDSCAAFKCL